MLLQSRQPIIAVSYHENPRKRKGRKKALYSATLIVLGNLGKDEDQSKFGSLKINVCLFYNLQNLLTQKDCQVLGARTLFH